MSALKCQHFSFPAFSGLGSHVNQKSFVCHPYFGGIPPGKYYIIDRQSGGLLGPIRDLFSDKKDWFALYAVDSKIDDETFCDGVRRGNFRLHPKGRIGISEGCVTVENHSDFHKLRLLLKGTATFKVPGTSFDAYGVLTVS